jgi:hypothetical protein
MQPKIFFFTRNTNCLIINYKMYGTSIREQAFVNVSPGSGSLFILKDGSAFDATLKLVAEPVELQ